MRTSTGLFSAAFLVAAAAGTVLGQTQDETAAAPRAIGTHAQSDAARVVRIFDQTWAQRNEISDEELQEAAQRAVEDLNVDSLSAIEIGRILTYPTMLRNSGRDEEIRAALDKFLDAPGAEGATAHLQTLAARARTERDAEKLGEMLRSAITHPGLEEALQAGAVRHMFMRLDSFLHPVPARREALQNHAEEIYGLQRLLTRDNAVNLALSFRIYHDLLEAADADGSRTDERNRIRQKLVELGEFAAGNETNAFFAMHMGDQASFLNSPYMRGELIGHAAPDLTINWSSDDAITSLASLKGQVVVLDFWATWCGPCIASFPQFRSLVEHFEGYPVTILGVTSIQGRHIERKADGSRETIDTRGEPEREMSLMAGFMSEMEMTWPVVFTEENVFNPDYGVRGIPHVAIIDPAGKVRHNELRPRQLNEKIEYITELLREAGLPAPASAEEAGDAAAPMTLDEQIAAAVDRFRNEVREHRDDAEAREALAQEVFGKFDLSGMSLERLQQFRSVAAMLPEAQLAQARTRLVSLARDPGLDGFEATLLMTTFNVPARRAGLEGEDLRRFIREMNETRSETTKAVLRHAALKDAMQGEHAGEVLSLASRLSGDDLAAVRDEVIGLADSLSAEMPSAAFARLTGYYRVLMAEDSGVSAVDRERVRQRLVSIADEALEKLPDEGTERTRVERAREFLAGAFARGDLVGNPAPPMEFIWSSTPAPLTSLADLRGKVVVIDFWATWCGPCIASFPQVRDLTAHYEGYPVVVLGVTSVQGSHTARKLGERSTERISTDGDPEREFELMKEFMQDMEMTWPVVFSSERVFNPDFGVTGIPHVAIIDPAGNVRYRGLHPARPLAEKTEKIDGLLREAGLPVPPPSAEGEDATAAAEH